MADAVNAGNGGGPLGAAVADIQRLPMTPYPICLVEFGGQAVKLRDVLGVKLDLTVTWEADAATITLDNRTLISDFIRKEHGVGIWMGRVADPDKWNKLDLVHVFEGRVDGVLPDFGDDQTLELKARDYSRALIDTERTQAWTGLTASAVAVKIATEFGLGTKVRATQREVDLEAFGLAPQDDLDSENFIKKSPWEVLQTLALREGYVCYVDVERVLHFEPKTGDAPSIGLFRFREAPFDVLGVQLDDSAIGLANQIRVVNWIDKDTGYVEGVARADANNAETGDRVTPLGGRIIERVVYSKTAMDEDAAKKEAQAILLGRGPDAGNAKETLTGKLRLRGDAVVAADVKLALAGAHLGRFQGDYYVHQAAHDFDASAGWTVEVDVTNVRPDLSRRSTATGW
jgi:phage protein D